MADSFHTAQAQLYLLSCAVNSTICERKPDEFDFDGLHAFAEQHAVCSAVAFALESAGIREHRFEQAKLKTKRKLALFDIERQTIFRRFNEADIRYAPLKGIVMQEFYPRYGMREMTDNDILCDGTKMDAVRDIMESLGYQCESFGELHHDTYLKPPTLCFEMHHRLFSPGRTPVLDRYYADVSDRLIQKEGCARAFSDEDFYIYLLAHTYKHFSHYGTGLRPLMDIRVYLQTHPSLDLDYIERELEKLQIARFEQRCRSLAVKLFGFQPLDQEDAELLPRFLGSTLYGTVRQREYNKLTDRLDGSDTGRAKAKYIFDRVFPRGEALERNYPFFARHKWLLPVLYLYRPFKGLFTRPGGIAHETKNLMRYRAPKDRL